MSNLPLLKSMLNTTLSKHNNYKNFQRTKVTTDNFTPALWTILTARAKRNVKYFESIEQPWPDVTVKFVLKRTSAIDRKLSVLPLVRKMLKIIVDCDFLQIHLTSLTQMK